MQETQEMQVRSLGQEDPLEQEMATDSNILAWKIPWTEKPGGLQSMGSQRVRHDCVHTHTQSNMSCVHVREETRDTQRECQVERQTYTEGRQPSDRGRDWRQAAAS